MGWWRPGPCPDAIVLANLRGVHLPEDRPFIKTVVQLAVGTLFIAISATVTPASLRGVTWPTLALVALLVLLVRPADAVVATARSSLTRNEKIFIGAMDPRGIVAASTAASFSAPLVKLGIGGADKLLAATFLVIVGTVAIYGLGAAPLARALGLRQPEPEKIPAQPPEPTPAPSLDELRQHPALATDVNHGHLATAVVAPDGNILGIPATLPLNLAGLPATTRDGHLRAAISSLIATALACGARAIVIEDLDFAGARAEGRERHGNRPSRGRRGRGFRRAVAGIPTARFRDRLVQMASNAGLPVIVVDPAYTSRWGAEHWLGPLREHHPKATGHHAAALVIGRRGLGHRARRRATGNHTAPAEAARPAQARPRTPPAAPAAPRKPATPPGPRQPPGTKTRRPHRTTAGNQAAQDRPGPPSTQDYVLLDQ